MNENYKNLTLFRNYIQVGMVYQITYHAYLGDKLQDHVLRQPKPVKEIKSKSIGFASSEGISYLHLKAKEFKATNDGFYVYNDGRLIISYKEIIKNKILN